MTDTDNAWLLRNHTFLKLGRWLMYATLLVPVVLGLWFFFPFVSFRGLYFRFVIDAALALFLFLFLARASRSSVKHDYILLALSGFVAAQVLAAAFGFAKWRSFFGDFERMWGVWTYLHLLAYYVLLRVFLDAEGWIKFLRISIIVCALTCVYGIIQYYQDVLGIKWEGSGGAPVYSTIGNSGLYAAYLLFNLGFAIYLWCEEKSAKWKWIYLSLAAFTIVTLFLAANRSTILGVMVGVFIAAVCYSAIRARKKWIPPLIALAAVAMILAPVIVLRTNPDSSLRNVLPTAFQRLAGINTGTDGIRLYQWRAALNGFQARPLLGYGPENYNLVWSAQFDPRSYRFGAEERWDRAHNAYLEVLSTSGIIGSLAFIALFATIVYMLVKAYRRGSLSPAEFSVLSGLFGAYTFYLIFWFFDLNSTMLFIVMAALITSRYDQRPLTQFGDKKPLDRMQYLQMAGIALLFTAVLYVHVYSPLRVSNKLHRVMQPGLGIKEKQKDFEYVFVSPAPQKSAAAYLYGNFVNGFRDAMFSNRTPEKDQFMGRVFNVGLTQLHKERLRDPHNERIYVQEARMALLAAAYYSNSELYNTAVELLNIAVRINPRRLNTYFVLANVYLAIKEYPKAYEALAQAYRIYPVYGQTHYQLAQLEFLRGNVSEAGRWLKSSLDLKYAGPVDMVFNIGEAIGAQNKDMQKAIYKEYVTLKYPSFAKSGVINTAGILPPQIMKMVAVGWPGLVLGPR